MIVRTSTRQQFDTINNVPCFAANGRRNKVRASSINNNPGKVSVKIFHKTGVLCQIVERKELDMVLDMFKGCKTQISVAN